MERYILERNIRLCYALRVALGGVMLVVPSLVGYWQAHGLNFKEITLLQMIFAIGVVVLEVPTGYFADCVGRRAALVFGAITMSLGELCYALAIGFSTFAMAEILIATALALWSGADQALIRSSLRALGREEEFTREWAKQQTASFIAMAIGGALGGWLATVSPVLPFWMSAANSCVALICTLLMVEPYGSIRDGRAMSALELFALAKVTFVADRKVCWLIIFPGIVNTWLRLAVWFYQPYFEICKLSLVQIGLVFAAFNLIAATSSKLLGPRWSKDEAHWLVLLLAVSLAYLAMGSMASATFGWMIASTLHVVRGITSVAFSSLLREEIEEHDFATIGSIQSFAGSMIYAACLPFVGAAADTIGVMESFVWISLIGLVVSVATLAMKPWKLTD